LLFDMSAGSEITAHQPAQPLPILGRFALSFEGFRRPGNPTANAAEAVELPNFFKMI
jgi:hypothetical protein